MISDLGLVPHALLHYNSDCEMKFPSTLSSIFVFGGRLLDYSTLAAQSGTKSNDYIINYRDTTSLVVLAILKAQHGIQWHYPCPIRLAKLCPLLTRIRNAGQIT